MSAGWLVICTALCVLLASLTVAICYLAEWSLRRARDRFQDSLRVHEALDPDTRPPHRTNPAAEESP